LGLQRHSSHNVESHELKNLVHDKKYGKELEKWRQYMVDHLAVRGEPYIKDGKLTVLDKTVLTSPNYTDSQ
jgi:hypothetical protein